MKYIISLAIGLFIVATAYSQKIVESNGVSVTNVNVDDVQVLSEITINPFTAGKVVVRFNGLVVSSPGDRIILAANNTPDWAVNAGNVNLESISSDFNSNNFSHSRVYDVAAGTHTYYAVMQRFVETAGSGLASVYGNFTVEFFPTTSVLESISMAQSNVDLSSTVTLGQVSLDVPSAGKVIVHFDGNCVSSPGDRIILAASNSTNWSVNDGNVSVEAYDSDITRNSFSHTRVYNVGAGVQNFYAVAQNLVETAGSGTASFFGNLTAEFVPDDEMDMVLHEGIIDVNQNLNALNTIESIDINPDLAGKVIVRFNGVCVGDPGDYIVLAATNTNDWTSNDGNTGIEAIDDDLNTRGFTHTRVYEVGPGLQTFNAVAQNFVETAGDGIASIYGSLMVKYISNSNLFECENPLWYVPEVGSGDPAMLLCEPQEGYTLAHQQCAELVIIDDDFCIESSWDSICQDAYVACVTSEGCTYPGACNYDITMANDDGSCVFPGCTDETASNYDPDAICNDSGLCEYECTGDLTNDNFVTAADLTVLLSFFGTDCNP